MSALDYYSKNNYDELQVSDLLMKKIKIDLGEPLKNNLNWENANQNHIELFNRWLIKNKIDDYFGMQIKDMARKNFWLKYRKYIKKLAYFEKMSQAIVMETEQHTFVEFGETGNAMYCYDIQDFGIAYAEVINKDLKYNAYKKDMAIKKLKNKDSVLFKKDHRGDWELSLENDLMEYNYYAEEKRKWHL